MVVAYVLVAVELVASVVNIVKDEHLISDSVGFEDYFDA